MRRPSVLLVIGTLASVIVAAAPMLALETQSEEVGCVSSAELEGVNQAPTPELAVRGLQGQFANLARHMGDPADAERMKLIAVAAGASTARGETDGRLIFGGPDVSGNPSAEFGVRQTADGSWQVVSVAISLPQRICDALADRL